MPGLHVFRHRAVTLIEAVLFISIALGLIVGGIVFFQQASTAQRTSDTLRAMTAVLAEARAMYRTTGTFTEIAFDETLVAAGAVPSNMVRGGDPDCALQSPWGECMQVEVYTVGGGNEIFIALMLYGIPPEVCTRLAHADAAGSGPLGAGYYDFYIFSDLTGHGRRAYFGGTNDHYWRYIGALSPADAGAMCADLSGGADTMARFVFRLAV